MALCWAQAHAALPQVTPKPAPVAAKQQETKPLTPEAIEQKIAEIKCYCSRCGGVAFCPDYEGRPLCLGCDWETLAELYPGMAKVKH
jgi:hypothetical protein